MVPAIRVHELGGPEGSIADDKGATATRADDNSNGISGSDDSNDLWYENSSENASDMEREWERRHYQFHTIGYRDGLIAGKEAAAQEGFDIGFKESILSGYNWGRVRGIASAMACLTDELKEKLVETEETRNDFLKLHEEVQSLSTTDALKLFYEDHRKRISEKQKESDPTEEVVNHQGSVLDDYSRKLQSLLRQSSMLEKASEIVSG